MLFLECFLLDLKKFSIELKSLWSTLSNFKVKDICFVFLFELWSLFDMSTQWFCFCFCRYKYLQHYAKKNRIINFVVTTSHSPLRNISHIKLSYSMKEIYVHDQWYHLKTFQVFFSEKNNEHAFMFLSCFFFTLFSCFIGL